jgi:hypothetical protein
MSDIPENVTISDELTDENTAAAKRIAERILSNGSITFEPCAANRPFLIVLKDGLAGAGLFDALHAENLKTVGVSLVGNQTHIHVTEASQ